MQQSSAIRIPLSPRGRVAILVAILLCGLIGISGQSRAQSTIPNRFADTTFWRMTVDFSEPNGFFRSDNLLSNESSFQWVVPSLAKMTRPDGVRSKKPIVAH